MRIIYFPLEPLKERYTWQLSAPFTGWLESRWLENNIPFIRIEGKALRDHIKDGQVLDANGRGYWATSQIQLFLQYLDSGQITSEDVLFFDDFWHPGISALPYSFHVCNIHPKMYAFLYAQTVDPFDFTYPMRDWMRHFEIGTGKILDGIFVTSTALCDALLYAGIGTKDTVHITGLLYNSDEVKKHWPTALPRKKKQVIYVSRWDEEKRPDIFFQIVDKVLKQRKDIKFLISTSFEKIRSNRPGLVGLLKSKLLEYPYNLVLKENQTKDQYYLNLLESRIQINTADQDWVSWTLLEATTCGCRPLYPNYLSFPEALNESYHLMYNKNDVNDAAVKILTCIDEEPTVDDFISIYRKYDEAWKRMLCIMNGEDYPLLYQV